VLPNGPEAATAFVAIAAGAITAPLSPLLRPEEYQFNLSDLRAKILVVEAGTDSPARAVAQKLGVPVVELHLSREQGAGYFALRPVSPLSGSPSSPGMGQTDDEALVLHTSGSTARPKIVPLSQRNVLASSRLIRSSSASLPPPVMAELERTFRAPVIEAYGMTQAAHQMTSNPLPPKPRKPGTVGIAAGPEVAVMGDEGNILGRGRTGEVVIRGPNVTAGYEANPSANEQAFIDEWFRTGDQGEIDSEGYLKLTGRLKELINRGGEKIGPLEIDAVLMEHPAIQQCCAFAMPHDKLGEEIAAAVVVREGKTLTERELQQFAEKHLAHFKIPRKVVFLMEIPKGPSGKLQRI